MPLFGNRRPKGVPQGESAERMRRAAEAEASGLTCLKEGNLQSAEVELRRCIELNPSNALGHGYLGLVLYRLGKLEEASQELRTAIALMPEDEVLHRTHGMILDALSQGEAAAEAYASAIAINPRSARAHAALGSLALKRGDLAQAEDHVTHALKLDPNDTQALGEMAEIRHQRGNLHGAIETLRSALAIHSNSSTFHFKLGLLLEEARQLEPALNELRAAHEGQPNDPAVIFALGRVLMKNERAMEVQHVYERAMKAAPANHDRYEADLYRLLVEHSVAPRDSSDIEGVSARRGTTGSAKPAAEANALIGAVPAAGSIAAAIALLEASLLAEPNNSRLYRDLSIQYMRAGRLKDAKDMASKAEQLRAAVTRLSPSA